MKKSILSFQSCHTKSSARRCNYRPLAIEQLESRELLAVSLNEYNEIRNLYPEFELPAAMSNINVSEMLATNGATFNLAILKSLINTAQATPRDDLIVVRTTSNLSVLTFNNINDELIINGDSTSGKLTIVAYGTKTLTINSYQYARCLTVEADSSVQLGNMLLKNGKTYTGGIGDGQVGDEYVYGIGGGILNRGTLVTSHVEVNSCEVDSKADSFDALLTFSMGGGIYNSGTLKMYHSTVTKNTAHSSELQSEDDELASGIGGGIYNSAGNVELVDCVVSSNVAESKQGTYTMVEDGGDDNEKETVVSYQQEGLCGGIFNENGVMTIRNSTISGNEAWDSAGIRNFGEGSGDNLSELTIIDSVVSGNKSHESGGGIFNGQRCVLNVYNSFIQGNSTAIYGGGIETKGSMKLVNSVVSGNTSTDFGGGIRVWGEKKAGSEAFDVEIVNCTITGNQSNTQGGGISFSGGSSSEVFARTTLVNTIVVDNRANSGADISKHDNGPIMGYNNISTFTSWTSGENNVNYNPNIDLFRMRYNFGSSSDGDYHLVADSNSQAVNKGDNARAADYGLTSTSFDITGAFTRINEGKIDIGAWECDGKIIPAVPLSVPENLNVTVRSATSTILTWAPVVNAQGYRVQYRETSVSQWTDYSGQSSDPLATTATVTGLTGDKTYYFRVQSVGNGLEYTDSVWSPGKSVYTHINRLVVATSEGTDDGDDSVLSFPEAVRLAGTPGWGNDIVFAKELNGVEIELGSNLTIERGMTIDAADLSRGITLNTKPITISQGANVTIKYVHFAKISRLESYSTDPAALIVNGTLQLFDSQIADNGPRGIYVDGGTLKLDHCTISNNYTFSTSSSNVAGGGIYASNSTLELTNCVIAENGKNLDVSQGGGIYAIASDVTLKESSILSNNAVSGGGVYFDGQSKDLAIESCRINGNGSNSAQTDNAYGGGIHVENGTFVLINSLMAGNRVFASETGNPTYNGSALYQIAGSMNIVNSTITGNKTISNTNTDTTGAAVVYLGSGSPTIANTIVAGNELENSSKTVIVADLSSTVKFNGQYNVTTNSYDWAGSNSTTNHTSTADNLFVIPPRWTEDNVYSEGDYNLIPGAVAIDRGNNSLARNLANAALTQDLDAHARVVNSTVDIGAFEAPLSNTPRAVLEANTSVCEGCAVYLDASGSVANGGEIDFWLWDLDGDGKYNDSPEEKARNKEDAFWYTPPQNLDKSYHYDGSVYTTQIGLKVKGADGKESLPVYHTLKIEAFCASIETVLTSIPGNQSVVCLNSRAYLPSGNIVQTWTIDWGDGKTSTWNYRSQTFSAAHYYSQSGDWNITINIVDSDGLGRSSLFAVGVFSSRSTSHSASSVVDPVATDAAMLEVEDYTVAEDIEFDSGSSTAKSSSHTLPIDYSFFATYGETNRRNRIFLGSFE